MVMKIRTLRYYIVEGVKSVIRNRVMSFASVTTVAAALFILGVFMLLAVNVNNMVNTVQKKVEIKAFLNEDVTTLKQKKLEKQIEEIKGVTEVNFESKQEALENFKKQLGENEDLAKGLDMKNPLPASFIVKVDKPENVKAISAEISKLEGIDQVKDGKEIIDKIIKITNFVRAGSIGLMVILGTISIFLISNTIKLTVYARKREIGIMKYIGATDWFIRWPFIIEGVLLGIIGAGIAIGILGYGYSYAVKTVSSSIMLFSLVPVNQVLWTMSWQFVLIGMLIGGIGSILSLRKFLVV
jgi:cell division transport system permease protein